MNARRSARNQIRLFSVIAALALFLGGCQGNSDGGPASVHLTLALPHASKTASKAALAPAPSNIGSIQLEVTGPGMAPISTSVPIGAGGNATLVLEVPAGLARRFVVTALDGENTPLFRGEATVDLAPGSSPNLTVSMVSLDIIPPPPPSIQISPHTAVVAKDSSQTFSVSGIDLSQVQWEVTSAVGNDPNQVGSLDAADGGYNPPGTILTDAGTPNSTPIGNPLPVTVTAIDKTNPTIRDSATVTLTTGAKLNFEKNQPVTPSPSLLSNELLGQRRIAFYNGKVYAVWADCPDGCLDIFFSETSDGANWTEPISVASNSSSLANPTLAVSPDGTIYIAYVDCLSCSTHTIQLIVRPFGQTTFKSIPLTMASSSPQAQDPMVAIAPSGVAFVTWSDTNPQTRIPTGRDIYLQRIPTDSGKPPRKINTDTGNVDQNHPVISISNSGEVFLAWEDLRNQRQEIFSTASIDGGENFLSEVQVSATSSCCMVSNPTLTAGPTGTAYIAWQDDRNSPESPFIFFNSLKIDNGNLVPGTDRPVGAASTDPRSQSLPSITWDGRNDIYLSFQETFNTNNDGIFLAKTVDGGNTFNFSRIDDDSSSTFRNKFSPSLAVDSAGRAFAIWTDGRLNGQQYDVFFAKGE